MELRPGFKCRVTARDFLRGLEACKLAVQRRRAFVTNRHSITAAVFIRFLQLQGELPLPPALPCAAELWPLL
jgi:hypothetical protein